MERAGRNDEFNRLVMLRRPELATRAAGYWRLATGGWQLAVRGSNKIGVNKENVIRLTLRKQLEIIFRL